MPRQRDGPYIEKACGLALRLRACAGRRRREAARCAASKRPCTRTCTAAWWLLTRGIRRARVSGQGQLSPNITCLEVCHRLHYIVSSRESMLIVVRPPAGPAGTLMTRPCRIGYNLPSTTMLTSILHHGTGWRQWRCGAGSRRGAVARLRSRPRRRPRQGVN